MKKKAELFNKFFAAQCTPLNNNSSLPAFLSLTENKLDTIRIAEEDILSIIRSINPKKSNGPDQISGHMLRIADDALVTPLKLIFTNILRTSTYHALWKQANVTPVHKKGDKQEAKNYRPISLSRLFGNKIFEMATKISRFRPPSPPPSHLVSKSKHRCERPFVLTSAQIIPSPPPLPLSREI